MKTTFDSDVCKITNGAMIVAHGKKEGTLYMTSSSAASISISTSELDVTVWHQRLGHMSKKGMNSMPSKDELLGLKFINLDFCEDYVYKKKRRVSFSKARKPLKTERLELVHTDVWGKASVPSLGGSLYFVTFIDDSSRKVWIIS